MKRKRYDTVELVGELRRERRVAVLLSLAGVAILGLLAGVYFSGRAGENVPAVPGDSQPVQPPVGLAAEDVKPIVSGSTAVSEEAPQPVKPATLKLVLTKKALVLLDGKALGSFKEQSIELTPGKHEIRVKLGKKAVSQTVAAEAGASYELRVDTKKRKALLKKLK